MTFRKCPPGLALSLAACGLAGAVVAIYLSHWSLLDGAPRNSLGLFLQQQAERPFAYRWLMPLLVKMLQSALPMGLQELLAQQLAPPLLTHFVQPVLRLYEPALPGLSARALTDWQSPAYRVSFVLMVALVWACFVAALLLLARIARHLGCSTNQAGLLILTYALVYPSTFLHAAYFYDFGEQMLVCALIYLALRQRWKAFALTLVIMQCNRETALLTPLLLSPLLWPLLSRHKETLKNVWPWLTASWLACMLILWLTRQHFSGLPGQDGELNLSTNLAFWLSPAQWLQTSDLYAIGLPLPRLSFVLCMAAALIYAGYPKAHQRMTPAFAAAGMTTGAMLALLLVLGYKDEYRAVALCLPVALVAVAARWGQNSVFSSARTKQAATVRPELFIAK